MSTESYDKRAQRLVSEHDVFIFFNKRAPSVNTDEQRNARAVKHGVSWRVSTDPHLVEFQQRLGEKAFL